jgi:integrase
VRDAARVAPAPLEVAGEGRPDGSSPTARRIQGQGPTGRPIALAPRATFRDVGDAYLAHLERLVGIGEMAPRTFETYQSCLQHHALPRFGPRQVASVTPEDLVAWHHDQRALGASPWTIRSRWIALRGVLAYATRHLGIPNAADRLTTREVPKAGAFRKRILSPEEMGLLIEHAPLRYRAVIATALFSGMRASELLGLTWADVDFGTQEIHVRAQMGRDGVRRWLKTDNGARDIVLMPALASVLRENKLRAPVGLSGDDDLVFATANGRSVGHRNVSKRGLDPARTRAGLQGVTFLALRHTFASILIAQGNDVVFVSRQLGHSKVSHTLDMYATSSMRLVMRGKHATG